jgi:glycosyltransferase involved in cell wall biosynthesis
VNINNWSDEDKKSLGTFLQWNSYRSNGHRLFYVSTPKVACTSLKWWFASLEGYAEALEISTDSSESDPDLFVHDIFQKLAPDVVGLTLEELSEALTSPNYLRFAVVRNPYKRVFSAWQSKLLLREPLQIGPYRDSDFFNDPIETAPDIAAAFERFMEYLAKREAPNFKDHHWTPQANILRPDLIDYSRIVKIEEPQELINELNRWLGGSAVDPFSIRRANESIIPFLPELLTPRSIELIREVYARDFELFRYESKVPSVRKTFSAEQWDVALKAVKFVRARHKALGQRNDQIVSLKDQLKDSDRNLSHLRAAQVRLKETEAKHEETKASLRQAIVRNQEASSRFRQTETRLREAEVLRQATDDRLRQTEAQRDDAEARLSDTEQRRHVLDEKLKKIIISRSWRITAPLRNISGFAFRLRANSTVLGGLLPRRLNHLRQKVSWWMAVREVRASELFDVGYYQSNYPDVAGSNIDPATHFVVQGWKEQRNPSAAFHTSQYLSYNPDVAKIGMNPLVHYLRFGRQEGREVPLEKGQEVSGLGSTEKSIDARQLIVNRERLASEIEAIRLSGRFDERFYLAMYPELALEADGAIQHYCENGWKQGLNPSDDFDTKFYLSRYHDIQNAGINPFWHYVIAGAKEEREATPKLSGKWEDDVWFGEIQSDIKLLAFYASPRWNELRLGRPAFTGHSQPKLPDSSLGYYSSADADVLRKQAEMARRHGLFGFCFELMVGPHAQERQPSPLAVLLRNDDIAIRYCVSFQLSAIEAIDAMAEALSPVFSDRRYIRVDEAPLLVVDIDSEALGSIVELRRWFRDRGLPLPFVTGRGNFDFVDSTKASELLLNGCSAVLDFPLTPVPGETGDFPPFDKNGIKAVPYGVVAANGILRAGVAADESCSAYSTVSLPRDNTVDRVDRPLVYTRFSLESYRRWLDQAITSARAAHREDRRFVFINAWNNWNEGVYLEPDREGGFDRLNETTRALVNLDCGLRMPKVSVVVPNYNHEPFLRRRLDSIYGQTYKNIEVLLLDDMSSDGSRKVMNEYLVAYPEITRTIYNESNSGSPFRQWAKGMREASGELVWIAESDDFCDERFLEILVRSFDDEAVLLAYGDSIFVDKDESPLAGNFKAYLADLDCAEKWTQSYVNTAHIEVQEALGIKNTIPNASSVLFRRPSELPLLEDDQWLSMRVAGDWVFYLHVILGGKIAYNPDAVNFFRRYQGSTAEATYRKRVFYHEVGLASRAVARLYSVPLEVLERCKKGYETFYKAMVGGTDAEFADWYNYDAVLQARAGRLPNVLVTTSGFYPGGAEILPIRLANEFKRQGLPVLLLSCGMYEREGGIRRMLRNDIPVVETPDVWEVKTIIRQFGIEALNSHQWHVQKYPLQVQDVFDDLQTHVASLHGMIEHEAFEATRAQIFEADRSVTTWGYTADKNLGPFIEHGLHLVSSRFQKIPNGMQPPRVVPISRAQIGIPDDAFVLCCVSRAIPDKGWSEAIDAVQKARDISGRDIRLILVGNGPVYDNYCRNTVPSFVYLAGFSENSVGYYAAADMGIMLTKFKSESFPLTIVDCFFAGKPYISSDMGEIRNMLTVDDGVAGAVIKLQDWEVSIEQAAQEIATFASDRERYSEVLTRVPVAAARYRIDVVASRYIDLFVAGNGEKSIGSRKR